MKPEDRDAAHLWDMLDTARETIALMEGFTLAKLLADGRTRRALERTLEVLGEVASRVSARTRNRHPDIPWSQIVGQRNVIAHGYAVLDYSRLFETVTRDLPGLVERLEAILERLPRKPER